MIEEQLALLRQIKSAALRGDLTELSSIGERISSFEFDEDLAMAQVQDLKEAAAEALSFMQVAASGVSATRASLESYAFADSLFIYGPDGRLQRLSLPSPSLARF